MASLASKKKQSRKTVITIPSGDWSVYEWNSETGKVGKKIAGNLTASEADALEIELNAGHLVPQVCLALDLGGIL